MSGNPNKLSQFWQELKRRKVVHIITVYATAAFVIIELVNNVAEPLMKSVYWPGTKRLTRKPTIPTLKPYNTGISSVRSR